MTAIRVDKFVISEVVKATGGCKKDGRRETGCRRKGDRKAKAVLREHKSEKLRYLNQPQNIPVSRLPFAFFPYL